MSIYIVIGNFSFDVQIPKRKIKNNNKIKAKHLINVNQGKKTIKVQTPNITQNLIKPWETGPKAISCLTIGVGLFHLRIMDKIQLVLIQEGNKKKKKIQNQSSYN